jgi:lysophospholipase L1-like esterase
MSLKFLTSALGAESDVWSPTVSAVLQIDCEDPTAQVEVLAKVSTNAPWKRIALFNPNMTRTNFVNILSYPFVKLAVLRNTDGKLIRVWDSVDTGDVETPVLSVLSLSNRAFLTSASVGTIIGALSGKTANSTLSVLDTDHFGLSGSNLTVGATKSDAGQSSVTVRETLAGALNSPRDSTFQIDVTAPVLVLQSLVLSANSFLDTAVAGSVIGAINNVSDGSTLSLVAPVDGRVALSLGSLVVGSSYAGIGSFNVTIRESNSGQTKDTTFAVTSAPHVVLDALVLSASTYLDNASVNTLIGSLSNGHAGSTLSLVSPTDGRVALSNANLSVGGTSAAVGNYDVVVRETNGAITKDTTFSITVVPHVILQDLTLAANTFVDNAVSGTVIGQINGVSGGSTLSITPNDGRLAIDGSNRLVVGLSAASAGSFNVTIRETNGNITKDTAVTIVVTAAGLFNFKTAQFAQAKAGAAAVRAGTRRSEWIMIGDSTTMGEGGGDSGNNMRTNAKERCWPTVMTKAIATAGTPASYESMFGSGANSGVTNPVDWQNGYKTGFTFAGGWGFSSSTTVGGCLFTNTTEAVGLLSITPQIPVDSIDLYDIVTATGGSIAYSVDGGAETVLSQAGTNLFRKTTVPCGALGTHTLTVRRVSGNAFVAGYRAINSAAPAIDVINLGRGSSTTADWVVATNPWSALAAATKLSTGADLIAIDLTINDALGNVAVATYKANMQTIINMAKATGASVLLLTGNPSRIDIITDAQQQIFRTAIKDLATTNDLPLIDQWAKYTDWVSMDAKSFMYNANHPNKLGYADLGAFVANQVAPYLV